MFIRSNEPNGRKVLIDAYAYENFAYLTVELLFNILIKLKQSPQSKPFEKRKERNCVMPKIEGFTQMLQCKGIPNGLRGFSLFECRFRKRFYLLFVNVCS